jgi:ABC-type Na+ efflux pump permease subunit
MKSFLIKNVSFCIFGLFILVPFFALAETGPSLTTFQSIPFVTGAPTTEAYVNALYKLSIAVASMLVVIKLIGAGVKYMLSEIVTNKEEAKKDIKGAIFGLLIILVAVTILNTINPDLRQLDFLRNASAVVGGGGASGGGSGGTLTEGTTVGD